MGDTKTKKCRSRNTFIVPQISESATLYGQENALFIPFKTESAFDVPKTGYSVTSTYSVSEFNPVKIP